MKKLELHSFEKYIQGRASQGTIAAYIYALRRWADWLNGKAPGAQSAQEYVDYLTRTGKSASTANLRAHAIMRYLRWKGAPIQLDCPTVRLGEPEYLTMDQLDTVLAASNTVLEQTLITVLFDTAVRINELLGLELDDIDWDYKLISVTRKGGRKDQVNITDKGLDALKKWLDARSSSSKRVFMGLVYYDAWLMIKSVGRKAGIPLHPHIFRHSRAVHMLMNGAELHIVQQHLGHKNIATTANLYGRFKAVHLKRLVPTW